MSSLRLSWPHPECFCLLEISALLRRGFRCTERIFLMAQEMGHWPAKGPQGTGGTEDARREEGTGLSSF